MSDLEHERARLHAMVDDFIDNAPGIDEIFEFPDQVSDFRIKVAGMVMIVNYNDQDEEDEKPVPREWARAWFETKDHYQKVGILETALDRMRGR
jgi:hypothetical protein